MAAQGTGLLEDPLAQQKDDSSRPQPKSLLLTVGTAAVWGGLARVEGWLLCGATLGLGALGLVDDWLKLRSPNAKGLSLMM